MLLAEAAAIPLKPKPTCADPEPGIAAATLVQVDPSKCKIVPPLPTAQTLFGANAATEFRLRTEGTLGTTLHVVPSKCRTSAWAERPWLPTAQTSVLEVAETLLSVANRPVGGP